MSNSFNRLNKDVRGNRPGYASTARLAAVSWFDYISNPEPGTHQINGLHLLKDTEDWIHCYVLPRSIQGVSLGYGETAAVNNNWKPELFIPGDDAALQAMLEELLNEPLLLLFEDPALEHTDIQFGSAALPFYFTKQDLKSGQVMDGVKGFSVEGVSVNRFFYNTDPTIEEIVRARTRDSNLPLDEVDGDTYRALDYPVIGKSSLLIIPLAYAQNIVYGLDSRLWPIVIPFSRNTAATRINKQGYIEDVLPGRPKMSYWRDGRMNYVIEQNAVNLVTDSVGFSSYDSESGSTVSAEDPIYDGATVLQLTKASPADGIFFIPPINAAGYYAMSLFLKDVDSNLAGFRFRADLDGNSYSLDAKFVFDEIDLQFVFPDGDAHFGDVMTETTHLANGWYRVMISFKLQGFAVMANPEFAITVPDDMIDGTAFLVCCPQFEAGIGSSYIPTTGMTDTRDADVISYQGLQLHGYSGTDKGCTYLQVPKSYGPEGNTTYAVQLTKSNNLVDDYQAFAIASYQWLHTDHIDAVNDTVLDATSSGVQVVNQFSANRLKQYFGGDATIDYTYAGSTQLDAFRIDGQLGRIYLQVLAFFADTLLNAELINMSTPKPVLFNPIFDDVFEKTI